MPEAEVNGTTINYLDSGTGPPLVLVHGLGLTHHMWHPQIEHFAVHHRVIAVDVRGAGASGELSGGQPVLETQAADLDALLAHLDIDRVVLCGVSYGGVLAQEFALNHPDRLAGLVIVDSFPDARLASTRQRIGLLTGAYLAAPMLLLPPSLLVPSIRKVYQRWPLAQQEVVAGYQSMRRRETARIRLAINRADYRPRLSQVRCPVLGIVGDESEQLVELMTGLVAATEHGRLEVLTDSFDPSNLCQPEKFNSLLADHLSGLDWTNQPD